MGFYSGVLPSSYLHAHMSYTMSMKKLFLSLLLLLSGLSGLKAEDDKVPFSKYKPNFITFGDKKDQTLLQFSFKYAVIKNQNFFIGYTQTSWWNIYNPSSPFYITHYNPELFYLWQLDSKVLTSVTFGFYEHKSNGRDGDASRSMDSSYVKFTKEIGHFELSSKFFGMYNLDSGNRDLVQYIGWWNAMIGYKFHLIDHFMYESIALGFYAGGVKPDLVGRGGLSADLTFAVPFIKDEFTPMITFQYFRGYGVNLFDYDQFQQNFRAGIVLYR